MAKLPCPPECQDASEAFQDLRAACDTVELKAIIAMNKARIAFAAMLKANPKMLVMGLGPLEEKLYGLAATGPKGRTMHLAGSRVMRGGNFELPVPGKYSHDDRPESIPLKIKQERRR